MALVNHRRVRGRPAHAPGPTYLTYTPSGGRLITVGSNNAIRVYITGSDGEPRNVDDCQESNTAVAATNDFFITGSEDGVISKYNFKDYMLDQVLTRTSLPVRDIAVSPDGQWIAVASDELTVKIVEIQNMDHVIRLREQKRPVKHLSYDPSGTYLAVSCSDGIVYIYSLSTETPLLVKTIDGLIRSLETDVEASSKIAWHPDGRAFAAATSTRDIQVMSMNDYENQKVFTDGHGADITDISWSPNGAMLASAGADGKILLWDTKTQTIIARYEYPNVMSLAWHPNKNLLSFTTTDGELFIFPDMVPSEHASLVEKVLEPAPFIHDPLSEISNNARRPVVSGDKEIEAPRQIRRQQSFDSLDDLLDDRPAEDFVEDDDGAGYYEGINENGKRPNEYFGDGGRLGKRLAAEDVWQPRTHGSFQPGSTPWRGNRKYLCLNLIGCVWTVDQETHHTVTVEFYDREFHREFHFTDPYMYDKACLNDNGTLFSCPPKDGTPAQIFYRPHETWTARADWRIHLPENEDITAIALSDSYIVVLTSADYVRVYTLYGTPFRIYRQKNSPTVSCAAWRDYVLTMGNGAVGGDGSTRLTYTIENVKRDEVCQSEDTVALTEGSEVKSVFFSDNGDPCIYDSTGVLLVLLHWRTPGQARWVPLLDTTQLERLATGRKEESYWPVAVAQDKFHCIILKGGDRHPYFPRPLLSEFDFQLPIFSVEQKNSDMGEDDSADTEGTKKLEESFVRNSLTFNLLEDLVNATTATHVQQSELSRREIEVDKILLQLLAVECRSGEERGEKALEIASLMHDRSGKMLEAAGKVAGRYGRSVLESKIREIAERRLGGFDED